MPVPVPRFIKPAAHPVIKKRQIDDGNHPIHSLTRTLPVSPTGPPPSFGTREEWINSLPTWRRTKPRRIWEEDARRDDSPPDFHQGLARAENASAIKGQCAEAYVPPMLRSSRNTWSGPLRSRGSSADIEMDYVSPAAEADNKEDNMSDYSFSSGSDSEQGDAEPLHDAEMADGQMYERGAFTPVFEADSPIGADPSSSPLEPVTPFGEFVDRAVVRTKSSGSYDGFMEGVRGRDAAVLAKAPAAERREQKEPAPSVQEVSTPSASIEYKKLAGPLAEWITNYVWQVCTTGLSLQPLYSQGVPVPGFPSTPPSSIATAVHSLLLSTLLQPSAVFLAIWYIVRLPVYFGPTALGPDHVKEHRFRHELLGGYTDPDTIMQSAPFRVIVLGCMFANKWLDDHTFSNKTWQAITNIPIQSINRLESLALAIFDFNMSVPPTAWSHWLSHVMNYHLALSPPSHQPIGRPSSNPHLIVKRVIDEITQAPFACESSSPTPEPVFIGLAERRRELIEKEMAMNADALEIDLDEDGPLREEYVPRRRTSAASSTWSNSSREQNIPPPEAPVARTALKGGDWPAVNAKARGELPPPARWSPAADEPILRDSHRANRPYVAVQPVVPNATQAPLYHVSQPGFQAPPEPAYDPHNQWAVGAYAPPMVPAYNPYPSYVLPVAPAMSHSRSQSLSYDQDNSHSHNHARSYSQHRDYRCPGELRMPLNVSEPLPSMADPLQWHALGAYGVYPQPAYPRHVNMDYVSPW
ncbi:hypothetical protein GGG16DRAFT_110834 [Schizophyllum commune]|nr:hypothetical protein K525DRAFT_208786 [Schizophyllum commune Loenen D]